MKITSVIPKSFFDWQRRTRLERPLLQPVVGPTIDLRMSTYVALRRSTGEYSALDPHEALVPQPKADRSILCPCARCTQARQEEYAVAEACWDRRRQAELAQVDRYLDEAPTQRDRDIMDYLDVMAKVVLVLIAIAFVVTVFRAWDIGAMERLVSR